MGVLSMYPIVTLEELPSVHGPFFAWRLVLDTSGGPLQVLHVHLRPAISDGGSWVVGYFSTRDDRERELAWHLARLDPSLPTLVVGDFNEELDGRAMRLTARLGYTDAIAPFEGAKRTWQWPVGPFTLRFQLDHLLFDAHFEPLAAGIVEAGRSDHKPIWADLARVEP
jgi:endonuclease/exonuclease/phosphatase family metal-dependent hydrolase